MKINKKTGKYNLSTRGGYKKVKYIVIHYTATEASAKNNCIYFGGGNRDASADFFIDSTGIWQYNPDTSKYYTWAVGDGYGKYGITNQNSISIEVVRGGDKAFTSKEIGYLKQLVPYLMKKYDVSKSRVVRHYDASRKQCPKYYAKRTSKWRSLRDSICGGTTEKTEQKKETFAPKYRVSVAGEWLSQMVGTKDSGGSKDTYAGIYGRNIGYLACNCKKYRVKTKAGWLAYVSKYDTKNLNSGCAGNGNAIYGVEILDPRVQFQIHAKGGEWSAWKSNGCITSKKAIDGIRIKAV